MARVTAASVGVDPRRLSPPRRDVGWRGRLALAMCGLVMALLVGEIVLRLLGPRVPGLSGLTSIASFQTYHPIYGFFHRPGAAGWIQTPEFTSYVEINSRGLRDREVAIPKPPGTFRILLLGDSFVEGAQVPLESTVASRLQGDLRATGSPSVEVVNAGNAGFGTAQELLFLENDGRQYEPDLVVQVFFVDNDLPDNGYAVSVERKLDTSRRPFFVPDGRGGLELRPFAAPSPDALSPLKTSLRQLSLLYNLAENVLLTREARDQENQQIGKNRPTYLVEPPEEWAEAWAVSEQLIARTRDAARSMGAEYILVVAPSNYQVSDEAWRWLVPNSQDRARRYDQEAPNRRLSEIARRTGVRWFDLLPTARAAAAQAALYYPEDGHWTVEGHAVGAVALAGYLRNSGLVPVR
jgi:hypothetical protein